MLSDDLSFQGDEPADAGKGGEQPASAVAILVCSSCRGADGSDVRPRPGERLALAAQALAGETGPAVRTVECLGNCKRRLSAALVSPDAWTYVFGDLSPESGADLIEGARLLAAGADGLLPWRGRPESLKRGLVARIPPQSFFKDVP